MNPVFQGILLGFSISLPIGPTNIEVLRRGFKEGWKASAAFAFGNLVALFFYLLLIILGLSFLTQSKFFNVILSVVGVIILFYLAFGAFTDFVNAKELTSGKKIEDHCQIEPPLFCPDVCYIRYPDFVKLCRTELLIQQILRYWFVMCRVCGCFIFTLRNCPDFIDAH